MKRTLPPRGPELPKLITVVAKIAGRKERWTREVATVITRAGLLQKTVGGFATPRRWSNEAAALMAAAMTADRATPASAVRAKRILRASRCSLSDETGPMTPVLEIHGYRYFHAAFATVIAKWAALDLQRCEVSFRWYRAGGVSAEIGMWAGDNFYEPMWYAGHMGSAFWSATITHDDIAKLARLYQ